MYQLKRNLNYHYKIMWLRWVDTLHITLYIFFYKKNVSSKVIHPLHSSNEEGPSYIFLQKMYGHPHLFMSAFL